MNGRVIGLQTRVHVELYKNPNFSTFPIYFWL